MSEIEKRIESAMPDGARRVVDTIGGAGGRICLVGGSIRDLLLDLPVSPWLTSGLVKRIDWARATMRDMSSSLHFSALFPVRAFEFFSSLYISVRLGIEEGRYHSWARS